MPVGRPKDLSLRRPCSICGTEYLPRKRAREQGVLYCSKPCSNSARKLPLLTRFTALFTCGSQDECWPWRGSVDKDGYGYLTSEDGGEQLRAHRIAYELAHGPIPDGKQVMHSCDNPPCVNPAHLSAGTIDDNNKDKTAKGRQAKGERIGRNRLTADTVRAIRSEFADGISPSSIATRYGVTAGWVITVVERRAWCHIK